MNSNYINYLQGRKYSHATITTYVTHINGFFNWCGLNEQDVRKEDVMDYMATLNNLSNNGINLRLSAIKNYYGFLMDYGMVASNPAANIKNLNPKPKVKPYISSKDAQAMIANTRTVRDKAILMVMLTNGLRISELINLQQADYDDMKLRGDNKIVIKAKGSKERIVYFSQPMCKVIDQYVEYKKRHANHCDNLFQSFDGNPIQRNNFSNTLKTIAKNAGLPYWNQISNHTMRAACASIYNEKGFSVPYIQDLLGHENINTTRRYIKTNQNNIQNMVNHGMDDVIGG